MTGGQSSAREQRRVERCNRILDAAEQVFIAHGFEAATMEEVADVAALAKGTLYLYFPSKEELFLGLTLRTQDELLRRYGEAAADATSGIDLLERILTAFYQLAARRPEYFRLSISFWLGRTTPKAAQSIWWRRHVEHRRRLFSMVLGAMERGALDGTVRDDVTPRSLALAMWSGALGGLLMELQRPRLANELGVPEPRGPLWPEYAALLVDAARAPAARRRPARRSPAIRRNGQRAAR
jgi:AcrR family transcriptional regulator